MWTKNPAFPDYHCHARSGHQNNKHEHTPTLTTAPGTPLKAPPPPSPWVLGPAGLRPREAPGPRLGLQPNSAAADGRPVQRRPNPGLDSHLLPPARRALTGAPWRRATKGGLLESTQGVGERGPLAPPGEWDRQLFHQAWGEARPRCLPPSAGPKPQRCDQQLSIRPFQPCRRPLTVLGLKEIEGRRLKWAGRRRQTAKPKGGEQGQYSAAGRRGVCLYRSGRRRRRPWGPWRHRTGGAGRRDRLTAGEGQRGKLGGDAMGRVRRALILTHFLESSARSPQSRNGGLAAVIHGLQGSFRRGCPKLN